MKIYYTTEREQSRLKRRLRVSLARLMWYDWHEYQRLMKSTKTTGSEAEWQIVVFQNIKKWYLYIIGKNF